MLNDRRIPTGDEHERIRACNERLTPLGLKAFFFSKDGPNGSRRPFRLTRNGRTDSMRYFTTIDALERYTDRVFTEQDQVQKLNVLLKMFDTGYKTQIIWKSNKCEYELSPSASYSGRPKMTFLSIRQLLARAQRMMEEHQKLDV
jgi:hypothetical protein